MIIGLQWGMDPDGEHLLREDNEICYLRALPAKLPTTIEEAVVCCRRIGVR